jgi:hypothetical protein
MNCQNFQTLLNRDLDGVLDAADAARLRAHVAACPRCASEHAALEAMRSAFRDLRQVDVPAGLADRIVTGAAVPRTPVLRIPRVAMIPIAASVLALCMVSAALGWRLKEPMQVRAHERLDEARYREFLRSDLALPEDKIDSILAIRRDFDGRFAAEKAELRTREDKLERQEIEAIWKLLPADAQERYRRHDPSFTPPATTPR